MGIFGFAEAPARRAPARVTVGLVDCGERSPEDQGGETEKFVAAEDRFGIVGKVVARAYDVESVVAEGGFGVVYRAYHRGFRANVALKCLKIPEDFTEDQRKKFLDQFRGEAEVLFRLSSQIPNIVRPLHVDGFQTESGKLVPFLALEWLEGRTLDAVILRRREKGRPPIPIENLIRILTPVAQALEQAHHLKSDGGPMTVVHRDMKPENIFIARMGNEDVAKILDFGISKVKTAAGQLAGKASQTSDGLVAFSPAFASPEQWVPRRFGQTGRWTDVWGLAITFVEAAKGSDVVCGDQAEMMGTILDPVRRPTPRAEGVQTNDAIESVFSKALAVDPRDRYQTVGEFWDDLVVAADLAHEIAPISFKVSAGARSGGRSTTDRFDSVYPAPAPSVGSRPGPAPNTPPQRPPLASGARLLDPGDDVSSVKIPAAGGRPKAPSVAAIGRDSALEIQKVSVRPPPARYVSYRAPAPSLWKSLSPAMALVALSIAVTVLDRAYSAMNGEPLSFGPVRASWIGALIMVLALYNGIQALRRSVGP